MKKETAIVAVVVAAVGSFFLGRLTAGPTGVVATAGADYAKIGAAGAGANLPPPQGDLYRVPVGASPWKGAENAKITIVEFSEFQCPFCSRVGPTMKRILDEYKGQVKIVFKHNPLNFHQDAPLASEASMAAAEQGKFWEFHDKLFANQTAIKRPDLERYAQELGLDIAKFKGALDTGKFKANVQADLRLGGQLGVDGTPSFFINGRMLSGAMPFDAFKKIIDEEAARADKALAAGVPLAALYEELTKTGMTSKKAAAPAAARGGDDANAVYKIPLHDSPAKGPATAKVTIVEFSEFECPFCSRVGPTLKQLQTDYPNQIRIVFKHNPLPFHQNAPLASEASMAAGDQGKFWEMHDKLFANQRALKRDDLERYATEIGLDMAAFKASLDGNKHKAQIDRDMATARQFGAMGTPAFFINGRKLSGAQPVDRFKAIIDEEMKKADAALAGGTKPELLYAELTKNGLEKAAAPAPQRPAGDDSKSVFKVAVGRDDACKGAKDALVTIVEFSEFECPFCSRVGPTLAQMLKEYDGKVRVCFKHNPLPFHKNAIPAANAAIEAHKQGKFWELHDKMFANQKALTAGDLERYAGEVGLDVAAVKVAVETNKYKSVVDEHQRVATDLGARGTPTFFINGRKLVGAQPPPAFKAIIDEELPKAEALSKRVGKGNRLYAEIIKNGLTKAGAAPAPGGGAAPDANAVYKVKIGDHTVCKGSATAQVTIAAFSEFQCPFCSRVLPTMKELHEKYGDKVRVCFFHNPLPFHAEAPGASAAALAANKQGKFWEYHDKLFANQRALKADDLERYAGEVGLDVSQWKTDKDSETFKAAIKSDQDLAGKLGARGTPTFFINGRKLVGAQPTPAFVTIVDDEIKKTDAMLKRGVAAAKLYETIIARGLESPAAAPPGGGGAPADDNKVYQVGTAGAPVKGNANAQVKIVTFSDFECPFCSRVNPTLAQIEKDFPGKVAILWKHYPLPFHQNAPLAHQASMAAQDQGKFWEYHDKLFANQRALKRDDLDKYAQELGLDMSKFKADLDSGKYKARIDEDMKDAGKAGIGGTPSFLINGKKLVGAQPYDKFKEKVQAALAGK